MREGAVDHEDDSDEDDSGEQQIQLRSGRTAAGQVDDKIEAAAMGTRGRAAPKKHARSGDWSTQAGPYPHASGALVALDQNLWRPVCAGAVCWKGLRVITRDCNDEKECDCLAGCL